MRRTRSPLLDASWCARLSHLADSLTSPRQVAGWLCQPFARLRPAHARLAPLQRSAAAPSAVARRLKARSASLSSSPLTQPCSGWALRTQVAHARQALAATGQQLEAAQAALAQAHTALELAPRGGFDAGFVGGDGGGNASALKWLVIGITSAPRPGGVSYLATTLASLLAELPDSADDPLGPAAVEVLVMNMEPGAHDAFYAARAGVGGSAKGRAYLRFLDRPGPCEDPTPDAPPVDDLNNPRNRPGKEVRRQTCDVATLLEAAAPRGRHYLFMEDDFETCGHALRALRYALLKAALRAPDWLALRVSYGMNGIAMRQEDLPALAAYLRQHAARLPPDLLWQEWASRGGEPTSAGAARRRPLLVFRQNLLAHTGAVSTFAVRPHRRAWPGCYAPMATVWSLAAAEKFDADGCAEEDLSPCAALAPSDRDWATRLPLFGVADDGALP